MPPSMLAAIQNRDDMSCVLTIAGLNLDIDDFVYKTKLRPHKKSYKGLPRFATQPDGDKLSQSRISIITSRAGFNDLTKQIADTIRYVKRNRSKLSHISSTKGIDYAVLNFGIDLRIDRKNVLTQSDTFPAALLKLAGDLNLDIELSIYPVDLQTILEKRYSKTKQKKT